MSRKGFEIMYKYLPLIFSNRLLGFLSFDVDVSRLDINQCDSDLSVSAFQLQTFKGTHKCHSETSQVRNWIILIIKLIDCKYCKVSVSSMFNDFQLVEKKNFTSTLIETILRIPTS